MFEFILGLLIGFVVGILFGRKNKNKVEEALAKAKEELEKLKKQ